MTLTEFKSSLKNSQTPPNLSLILLALWHDGKGEWESAHNIAQDIHSNEGSWVHAYLHRKEGDNGNASYWYSRAARKMPACSLEEEWDNMVRELLGES